MQTFLHSGHLGHTDDRDGDDADDDVEEMNYDGEVFADYELFQN